MQCEWMQRPRTGSKKGAPANRRKKRCKVKKAMKREYSFRGHTFDFYLCKFHDQCMRDRLRGT